MNFKNLNQIPEKVQEENEDEDQYEDLFQSQNETEDLYKKQVQKSSQNFTFNVYQNSFDYFINNDTDYDPEHYDNLFKKKY